MEVTKLTQVEKSSVSGNGVYERLCRFGGRLPNAPFRPTPMSTLFTILFSSWFFSLPSIYAQTVNITTADGVRAFDGTCLSAPAVGDNIPILLRPCDGNPGQRWDISTSGPHIFDPGFAIFILSGTYECLDTIAASNNPETAGLYTCGGRNDHAGGQASHQAFTYDTYYNSRGPLVLVPRNNYVNGGQGPGQSCLTASQGKLLTIPCDPSSPTPQQQFYLGFNTPAPSQDPVPNPGPPVTNTRVVSLPGTTFTTTETSRPSGTSSSNSSAASVSGIGTSSHLSTGSSRSGVGGTGTVTLVVSGVGAWPNSGGASPTGTASGSRASRRVNAIAIAAPIAAVAIVLLLAFILSRRCRNTRRARKAKNDVRTARPFVPTATSDSVTSLLPLHFAKDVKGDSAGSFPVPQGGQSTEMATTYPPQQPGDGGFLPADINRIVSMVVARIDTSRSPEDGQNPSITPDSDISSYDRDFTLPPARDARSVTSMQPNVNIDSILTVLGARVDPAYREQATLRDSTDLPPLYRLPPGYQG